jgi:hypothetical protein
MINIGSMQCSLAFAPYLTVSAAEHLSGVAIASRVVRQGGTGLILRCDGDLVLRHEHRQVSLGMEEVRHYAATIEMRREFYDILRMQDEVVLANVGDELLLSHPQSQMWLTREAVSALSSAFASQSTPEAEARFLGVPEWLKMSTGGGRLLLSDQRTARWVLLGDDHVRELERRLGSLRQSWEIATPASPTISLKGLTVHLQSAFKLSLTLLDFVRNGKVTPFEEMTPYFSLKASACTEGIELRDSDNRVVLTTREARKWEGIIAQELERLNAHQVERGGIRTVFAASEAGCWILQWGDEVFVPRGNRFCRPSRSAILGEAGFPIGKRVGEFLLLLNPATAACIALTDSESEYLDESQEFVA